MRIVTFDLEIEKPIPVRKGKPDWPAAKRGECGMSCCVLYDNETERYHIYDMGTIDECLAHLNSADLIVSWNGREFDVPVLEALSGHMILSKHCDLLAMLWQRMGGHRKGYKLDDVATRTLGHGKDGSGESAPKLAASGRWAELHTYCICDVALTRELFNHVQEYGSIEDTDGNALTLELPTEDFA
jgi:predicted PolB exonuclease-like 3'-5' exonuclease